MGKAYQQTAKHVLNQQKVDPKQGLSLAEARHRLKMYGQNSLEAQKTISPIRLFFSQFNDVLIIILIIAATISLGLSFVESNSHGGEEPMYRPCDWQLTEQDPNYISNKVCVEEYYESEGAGEGPTEAILIFAIVIAIAIIGFLNEYKAEKTVEALRKLVGQSAKVRRGGEVREIDAAEIVPGDILILSEGQKIPADARVISVKELRLIEASLTGESVPVGKSTANLSGEKALGDQKNMVFSGTYVASGTGEAVVVRTGQKTELGKIASMVNELEQEETPMQKKLDDLGKKLGVIVLAISVVVFVAIFFFNEEAVDEELAQRLILAFTAAVALAVAAIPEGLAFVVRISLALGARRMAAKDALVRKLSAVEALGSTDVVCSDKTGTLTKGEMTVRQLFYSGEIYEVSGAGYETKGVFSRGGKRLEKVGQLGLLLRIGALNNDSRLDEGKLLGDPTEGALLVAAEKSGLGHKQLLSHFPRVDELPFNSERKMMTTVHESDKGYFIAVKGAADVILDKCDRIFIDGHLRKLTATHKKEILEANSKMARRALRVLGFAYKESQAKPSKKTYEDKLIFVGLQGMIDPPREEVRQVIHRVHAEAGMRVLMVTGDHVDTAKAIAEEIGIEGEAITGAELDKLSQAEFEKDVEKISVYARVNPEHKIRIVQALKAHGHQVAMTGDGVNDAPAIKAADIGVAMGINGTDASKEASDLILLDDQFVTIIDAIEEGRGIFDNVRKFVNYLLSANIAEVITVLSGVLMFNKLVLSAAQLLFINVATDGLPAVALGSDQAEKGIMRYKPHRFQGQIITKRIWVEMFMFGVIMSAALLFHYWWIVENTGDTVRAVSVVFIGMVVYELVRLINIRSEYNIRWFSNPWLSVAMAGSIVLQLLVLYVPAISDIFGVSPILLADWLVIGIMSVGLHIAMRLIDKILNASFKETRPSKKAAAGKA